MIKNMKIFLSLMFLIMLSALSAQAQEMTFHGRLVDSTTNLGLNGNILFRVQVRTPTTAGDSCIMYEEQITRTVTNGVYVLRLNAGLGVRTDASGYTLQQIFSNKNTFGAFNLAGGSCDLSAPVNWTPAATDSRRIMISFYDSGTMAPGTWEPLPTQVASYVPMAIESVNVGGFSVDALLRVVNGAGSPFNVTPLNNTQYTELINTLTGNSSFYLKTSDPAVGFTGALAGDVTGGQATTSVVALRGRPISATAPVAGQTLQFNGTTWVPFTDGGGTVTSVTSANAYITVATSQTTPVLTLNVGTTSGTVAAGNDSRITGAIQAGSAASGDLTGTYPGPTVATVGGRTAAEINQSVTDTQAATNNATASVLVKRDASGNASFNTAQATNFSGRNVYLYNNTNTNYAQLKAPNALAVDYTLTLPTIAPVSGTLLMTNASGDTTWVLPSSIGVTNVTASAPLASSGGSTPNITIVRANGATDGYLASTDWTTFNNKMSNNLTTGMVWVGAAGVASEKFLDITNVRSSIIPVANPWFNVAGACAAGSTLTYSAVTDQVTCAAYSITTSQVTTALGYTPVSNVLPQDQIFVGNASGTAAAVSMTGDATIVSSGAITIANNAITTGKIANLAVTNAKINDVNWSKVTSTPTTIAGYGITDAILTQAGGVSTMQSATYATLLATPPATVPSRVFVARDTGEIWYSDGVSWILVGSAVGSGGTVTNVTANAPLSVVSGTTTPLISISQATGAANGYLTSTDWTTFNNKLSPSLASANIYIGNAGGVATPVAITGDAGIDNAGVLTLVNTGVASGTYSKVSVDAKGRVTGATNINSGDVTTALGYTPVNKTGDSMSGSLTLTGASNLVLSGTGKIAVGAGSADASSLMDLTSTSLGFLMPRMTTAQRNAIASPATGLQIFNITSNSIEYYNSGWQTLATTAGSLSSLNGLGTSVQYFAVGSSGPDFNISSVSDTHTFNIPTASAANNRGLLTSSDYSRFNAKIGTLQVDYPLVSDNNSTDPTISIVQSSAINAGFLSSGDWSTFNSKLTSNLASGSIFVGNAAGSATGVVMTGDATINNTGALSLINSGVTSGTYGSASAVPSFTVDSKGRLTFAGSQAYQDATNVTKGIVQIGNGLSVSGGTVAVLFGSASNTVTEGNDPRLSDARPPTGAASGDLTGTYPNPTVAAGAITNAKIANLAVTNAKINDVNWSKVTSTPTTVAGYGILDAILTNSGGVSTMQAATYGTMIGTAPGTVPSRVFVTPDTGEIYYSDGVSWIKVGSAAGLGGTVTNVTANAPLSVTSGTTTPVISISQATSTTNGYLTSADWSAFNAKVNRAGDTMTGSLIMNNANVVVSGTGKIGVGIGTPAASSIVDLTSTTLGFLMPRMTTAQRDAIASPAVGLQIFNTQTNSIDYYNGSSWLSAASTAGSLASLNGLTAVSQTFAVGSAGTDFSVSSAGTVHTFNIPTASAVNRGLLNSTDYSIFAAKIGSIQVDPPLVSDGDPLDPTISITQASAVQPGFLTSGDWSIFNSKLTSNLASGTIFIGNSSGSATAVTVTGDGSLQNNGVFTLASTGVASGSYSQVSVDAKGRVTAGYANQDLAAVSGTLGVANGGTGVNSITAGSLVVGNGTSGVNTLAAGSAGNVIYATSATGWASGSPNTAGLVDLTTAQVISGDKSFANILLRNGNQARFYNAANTRYVALQGSAALSTDLTFILPTTAGVSGQVMVNTGGGNLGWTSSLTTDLASGTIYIGNSSNVASGTALTGDATLQNSGVLTLASTGVTPGTYSVLTVDGKGRVTSGTTLTSSDITGIIGYAPVRTVQVDSPLISDGDPIDPTISIQQGSALQPGFITSGDWSMFNSKLTSNLASGTMFVGNGSGSATSVVMSGDATLSSSGVVTITNNAITNSKIANNAVTNAKINDVNWSKVTSTPTTVAGYGILDAILTNSGGVSTMQAATYATLTGTAPASAPNRVFVTPDTGEIYYSNGVSWTKVGSAAGLGGTVTNVSANAPLSVVSGTSTPVISISQATSTTNGYLTSADWSSFNAKVNRSGDTMTGALIMNNANVVVSGTGKIGVGTASPAASSIVDLTSTTLGFLMPRMDTTQRNAIASPATGLQIYNTTTNSVDYYNGSSWQQLATGSNALSSLNGLTAVSQTFTVSSLGTDFSVSSSGSVHSFNIPTASAANRGLLNSTDFSVFAAKIGSVQVDPPLVSDGDPIDPTISIQQGSASQPGFITSGDWSTFNSKLTSNLASGTIFIGNGSGSATSVATTGDVALSNGGVFTLASTGVASGTYSKVSVDAKGRVTGATNITSSDVTSALTYTPVNRAGDTMSGALIMNNANVVVSGTGKIGVGTASPAASSIVDLTSTTLGFLMPRMDNTQRNAIASPATGLQIYNTTTNTVDYYNGSGWQQIATGSSAISSINGLTAATQTFAVSSLGTDFSVSSSGSVHQFNIPTASAANRGLLNSTDFSVFAAKIGSVQVDPPLVSDGDPIDPTISIQQGSASQPGFITSGDWSTFNSKLTSNLASGTIFIGNGSGSATSVATTGDVALSNGGVFTLASTGVASGTYSKVSVDAKGRVTGATALNSTDVTTALTYTPVNRAGDTMSGALILNNANVVVSGTGKVGIGIASPNASSILDLTSTTLGFLMPRMDTTQRNAIASPATGLQIYNTTTNSVDYYNGSGWQQLATGGSAISSINGLTAATQTFTVTSLGTNFSVSSSGSVHSFNIPTASAANRGLLNSTDFSVFAAKIGSVQVDPPLVSDGDPIDPTISIQQGSASQPGFITSGDWSTFNSKLTSNLASGTIFIGNGSGSATSVATTGDVALSNGGVFTLASTGVASGTYSKVSVDAKGRVTGATVINSTDVTTALTYTPVNRAGDTMSGALIMNNANVVVSGTGKIGVGIATPNASSIVDLTSTTLGFLMPRMDTTQRNAIASPATGLQVYNTTTNTVDYYNGSGWQQMATGSSALTSLNGLTAVSQTFTVTSLGTNFSVSSSGSVHSFNIPTASAANRGLLNSTDFSVFAAKIGSVQVDPPLVSDGDPIDPTISIQQGSASQPGFITSGDWSTFNSKLTSNLASGTIFIGNGSGSATSVATTGDVALSNGGVFTLASTGVASGTYSKVSVDAKGRVTGATNITSSDVTSALTYTPVNRAGDTMSGALILSNANVVVSGTGKIGVGTASPAASSIVDLTSTTLGFLMPRMDNTQRNAIGSPATGLQIYNTTTNTVDYYNGSGWQQMATGGSAISSINGLTAATQTFAVSSLGNNFSVSSSGSVHQFNIPTASSVNRGLLNSTDFSVFAAKIGSVQVDPPLVSDGDPIDPTISIQQGSASQPGFITSGDWSTFNSKLTSNLASGTIFIGNGSGSATSVATTGDVALSNGGVFTLASTGVASGTYSKVSVDAKGRVTGATAINSTDVTTALTYTPVNRTGDTMSGALIMNSANLVVSGTGKIGVGTASPAASSIVDLTSTTLGFLMPRMDNTQRNAIASPATGLQIYNTTSNTVDYYNGSGWQQMATGGSAISSINGLTAATQTFSVSSLGTDFSVSSSGTVHQFNIPTSSASVRGLLASADWSTFNSKLTSNLASGTIFIGNGSGSATSVATTGDVALSNGGVFTLASTGVASGTYTRLSVDAKGRVTGAGSILSSDITASLGFTPLRSLQVDPPLVSDGDPLDPTISIQQGSASQPGFITSGDWSTFNSKLTSNLASGTIFIGNGSGSATSVATTGDVALSNGGVFTLASTGVASGTYSKVSVDAKGRVTGATNITSSDVTSALTYTPVNRAGDTMSGALILNNANVVVSGTGKIGVGTASPAASSIVDLTSTTLGFLMPRMDNTQRNAIASPATGLQIYNTTSNTVDYYNGSGWVQMATGGSAISSLNGLTGATQTFSVSSLGTDFSVSSSGTVHQFNIPTSSATVRGLLASADWSTFNSKLTSNLASGTIFIGNGSGSATSVATTGDVALSNGGVFTLASTGVASGTYSKVSVDAKGRVTGATAINSTDVTTALTYTPVNRAGDTMSGALIMNSANLVVSGTGKIGVGTSSPAASSIVDLTSTTLGFLMPRMDNTQRNAIASPATGLQIYNTTSNTVDYYNGSGWQQMATGGSAISSINGLTAATQTFAVSSLGNNFSVSSSGSVHQFNIPTASAANRGLLNSTDFSVFAAKIGSVQVDPPLVSDGDPIDPTISIQQGSASQPGFITSGDWSTFNSKLTSNLASGTIFIGNGSGSATSVATTGDVALSNGGVFTLASTGVASGTYSKVSVDAKGRVTGATNITSSDVTTALTYTPVNRAGDTMSGALIMNSANLVVSGTGKIGVGTASPAASSIVDLTSTTLGFLMPRMDNTQRNAIASPATGLQIYNTTSNTIDFYNGSGWQQLSAGGGITSLNGLTGATQTFSVSTLGSDFSVSSSGTVHQFNIPTASATARGLLSTADWITFNTKLSPNLASGTIFIGNGSGSATSVATTGDVALSNGGVFTLATTGVTSGTYQRLSVDAKGRVTGGYATADLSSVTGTLAVGNGGTGTTSITAGSVVIGGGTGAVTSLAGGAAGNIFYAASSTNWAVGTPTAAGLVDLSTAQTISGDKSFSNILVRAGNQVRFYNASGSNFVAVQASSSLSSDLTLRWPASNGSNNQVLSTDGSGNLSWATPAAAGITSLNGLTGATQTFSTSTLGTDFSVSSSGTVHQFNIPTATSSARGLLAAADWSTFNSKLNNSLASGTIFIGNGSGSATSVATTGDVGLSNGGVFTLASTGITSGTYQRVSVDAKGRVTGGYTTNDLNFVTNILAVPNGGTGLNTITSGSLLIGAGASSMTTLAGGSTGNMLYATGANTWASGSKNTIGIFANNGNAFSAPAVIGTTDSQPLNFMTNGGTRASLSTTGAFSVSSDMTLGVASGTSGAAPASPSKLTVNGQAYSNVQIDTTSTTTLNWDTNRGNVMRWATASSALAVSATNMNPGGAYMLVVKGAGTGATTISCNGTAAKYIPTNGARTGGSATSKTVYTVMYDGEDCLITWITGY